MAEAISTLPSSVKRPTGRLQLNTRLENLAVVPFSCAEKAVHQDVSHTYSGYLVQHALDAKDYEAEGLLVLRASYYRVNYTQSS